MSVRFPTEFEYWSIVAHAEDCGVDVLQFIYGLSQVREEHGWSECSTRVNANDEIRFLGPQGPRRRFALTLFA